MFLATLACAHLLLGNSYRGMGSQAELRLTMLALLECVMKQSEVTEEALRPHAQVLLRDMVVPNAVWQAGLVAATVRKVRFV